MYCYQFQAYYTSQLKSLKNVFVCDVKQIKIKLPNKNNLTYLLNYTNCIFEYPPKKNQKMHLNYIIV